LRDEKECRRTSKSWAGDRGDGDKKECRRTSKLWARIGVVVTKRNAEELQIVGEDTRGMDKKPSKEARKSSKNFKIVVFQRE
jgi:hypothetical protein